MLKRIKIKNKKGIAADILIKILIFIILFAIIAFAISYLLKRYGVI